MRRARSLESFERLLFVVEQAHWFYEELGAREAPQSSSRFGLPASSLSSC